MGAGTPAIALLTEHGVSFMLHEYELGPLGSKRPLPLLLDSGASAHARIGVTR
jgi:hypothetical protein